MKGRILIVDDDASLCDLLAVDLSRRDYATVVAGSVDEATRILQVDEIDVVVTDLNLPQQNGIELCDRIVANRPDVPVLVITAFGSLDTATAALRAGAYDFITKPVDLEILALAVGRALTHRALQTEVIRLGMELKQRRFGALVGDSPPMQELADTLARVADSRTSILITGESGTGKELVARALHERGSSRAGGFVAINCAALPESLLESELFGYEQGAFTDARAARKGLFLLADGGTLFLDEVGEVPVTLQPKLLRALEERRVRPLGGTTEIEFHTRLIAATNRDLLAAVENGLFREDLFYRLNVIQLEVPPLRVRGGDILLLAQSFLERFAAEADKPVVGLSEAAAERLLTYRWPGNVRELRNAMERAVALTTYERITVDDLPPTIRDYQGTELVLGGENPAELATLEEVERRYILHVLQAAGGRRTQAASILGIDRKTLYRKLQRYGIASQD